VHDPSFVSSRYCTSARDYLRPRMREVP
jgi:hypothetical protein